MYTDINIKLRKSSIVFPSCRGNLPSQVLVLHRALVETVPKSLRLSCGSELTDKEFRYLRPL